MYDPDFPDPLDEQVRADAIAIAREAVDSVLPDAAVRSALRDMRFRGAVVAVAVGKAAWRMAAAAASELGASLSRGIVITKHGHSEGPIEGFEIHEAGHPVPDAAGVAATARALELVRGLSPDDTVLFLVSGGGSALFELPAEGATLEDIANLTRALLACGADIHEINAVRKRLSAVKGGRFAAACAPARVVNVILSDVLGDEPDMIASGPGVPDTDPPDAAVRVVARHASALPLPERLRPLLARPAPDVPGPVETHFVGSVRLLCAAAVRAARARGYTPALLTTRLTCEARQAGAWLGLAARAVREGHPLPFDAPFADTPPQELSPPPCAVILGGETVVHLEADPGKGGRNQELALAAAPQIAGVKGVCVLSIGSDGTDGPTDAAGGVVTGAFEARCRERGLSIVEALRRHDAYPLLREAGGLLVTGPTGTNVNDLVLALIR